MAVALAVVALSGCSSASPPETTDFPAQPLLSNVVSREGHLRLEVFTSPDQPPVRGTIKVKLQVSHVDGGQPASGLTFEVVPEMPAMGHGTPVTPSVQQTTEGVYVVSDVNVFMAGRWDLNTTIRPAGGEDAAVEPEHVTISLDVR